MTADTHPVEREQLMAYLDGEVAANDAARVAAHIHECADCRQLEADLRAVSSQMLAWNVEPASPQLSENILSALHAIPTVESAEESKQRAVESAYRRRMRFGKWILTVACATVAILILLKMRPSSPPSEFGRLQESAKIYPAPPVSSSQPAAGGRGGHAVVGRRAVAPPPTSIVPPKADATKALDSQNQMRAEELRQKSDNANISSSLAASAPQQAFGGALMKEKKERNGDLATAPLIARTASLKVSVKNFQAAREGVDRIVQSFHGYAATMTVNSAVGEPQSLNAELHIPSAQSAAALAALKALGRVEQEQQGGEEVTAQVVDLDARLKNARETETRMQDILKTRTGKVTDVLEVENQIAEVRGNIEQMEAEQKQLRTRITFSTITLDLHEEYQASLETNAPSAGRRIRNAFIDGFRSAAEGSLALVEFLLSAGPSLLLATIILFWPARWAWRRFNNRPRNETALAQ